MGRFKVSHSVVILATIYLASIAAPLNQFKIPPVMSVLMSEMGINLSTAGLMMSVFAFVGIILAIPSGLIVHKLGIKSSGVAALSALLIGSCIGWASSNSDFMLISRIIEGIGMCLISVAAPAAIAAWFPPEKRGMPMGIWATWIALGSIIMLLIAPALNEWLGLKSLWAMTAIYTAFILVLMITSFRMPEPGEVPHYQLYEHTASVKELYNIKDIWLLAVIFMVFNIMVLAVCTFMPSFLEAEHAYSRENASAATSLFLTASLVSGPLTGILIHKRRTFKPVLLTCFAVLSFAILIPYHISGALVPAALFAVGLVAGMIPPATFSAVPEIIKDSNGASVGMSIVALGQYIGMSIGPVFFGSIADDFGWTYASYALVPVLLIGAVSAYMLKIK